METIVIKLKVILHILAHSPPEGEAEAMRVNRILCPVLLFLLLLLLARTCIGNLFWNDFVGGFPACTCTSLNAANRVAISFPTISGITTTKSSPLDSAAERWEKRLAEEKEGKVVGEASTASMAMTSSTSSTTSASKAGSGPQPAVDRVI